MERNNHRKISTRLSEAVRCTCVGRQEEISVFSNAATSSSLPFIVAFIHGAGGIGKSCLLHATLSSIPHEVRRYVMDCRQIEPTPQGFLAALGSALEMQESKPDLRSIVSRIEETQQRTILALDTYETFGLMDTYLRQVFVPSLSENVLTIIAGREAPNPAWFASPGWQGLFKEIELRELSADEAQKMLESLGLTPSQIKRVKNFARGNPLALNMAAAAVHTQPDLEIAEGPPPIVLQKLTNAFLSGLPQETMEAVEATSTVRRITEPLLRALLNLDNVREIFNNLQNLPFIDVTSEGLIFHDVVRDTISKDLDRRDPGRYRAYRIRAWSHLSKESYGAVARSLWQYTADILYLMENPVVRSAFFPTGATDIGVEPATRRDAEDIIHIAEASEPEDSALLLERWWNRHPEKFSVAKMKDGQTAGFYVIFEPVNVDQELLTNDPVTFVWMRHLQENPLSEGERVLFLRRWLDRTTGEVPSPAVGACFLDIKRVYMELKPSLRRIYTTVRDLPTFEPILIPVGFAPFEEGRVILGNITYNSIMMDFGPSSVDGWLANLVGAELGVGSAHAEQTNRPKETIKKRSRLLLTVLFTDIVGSTQRAIELGDSKWVDLLEGYYALSREDLVKFQGKEIDTAGDGFLATFEIPAQAIQCACDIRAKVQQLGLKIRAGLHLGECEVVEDDVRGIAVHIGARVAAEAEFDEVMASRTVKDAVAGSSIRFQDRGLHVLKGIPGEWRLFSVEH